MKFTQAQQQRIIELDAEGKYKGYIKDKEFDSSKEREDDFQKIEDDLVNKNKKRLEELQGRHQQPVLRRMEFRLVELLKESGFMEVVTPIKLAKGHLEKMGIDEEHSLWKQVYWLEEDNYCLRPMLAPNLYYLLGYFENSLSKPIKIFEVGPCFRRESRGSKHLSEFTMMNLVELGPKGDPTERLKSLIAELMDYLELEYELEEEESVVYGKTIDVVVNGIEVGSGAVGPHLLDEAWNISDSWVGVGFGLERLIICKEEFESIKRVGRSLIYQDGVRLNI
ncbi:pyrrolysine--tRNA(Pyl) ligase large subunit [Acetohalobium arabaticum]|uniref:Pyrrolysyl-tRNA synthetase n=1 Tax=Acetohalobium arabaticum (strain ATCC 49924 / DSM 5501 / Z-7288) TaxID=574087 RepID=D9QUB0_ACEAZ|nr:pyrrolysine--tRNA(Pyl) ligase large subunit [Acetohalobium arabaticum]ADL11903.1 Pyrrolysyl-tRNA synthetase [Acetohalobium arabaticum DSM 5501]